MAKRFATACAVLMLLAAPSIGSAQLSSPDDDIVDRVVAIVGDSVVLQSQLQEEVQRLMLTEGITTPPVGPELDQLMTEVLDQWINRVLILREAGRDSLIRVDDTLVEERVTQQVESTMQQVGGQPALQQALASEGLTLAEYRDMFRVQIRDEQTQQMFLQLRLRDAPDIEISEDDMLATFQAARGNLEQRPKMITFDQVVIRPLPSSASRDSARAKGEGVLAKLQAGEDFAELATAYSDDPGSGALGGDLGWFRRGRMVKEFEDAAFALLDGQVSGLVESQFGFHIIKIERSRPGERRGRHILLTPEMTEGDMQATRDTAVAVAALATAGHSMKDLVTRYADPDAPDSLTVQLDQVASLPPGYDVIGRALTGDVLGPIEYATGQGDFRLAIIKINVVREAGALIFDDVRGQLADQLQQQKKIAKLLDDLRANTYIEIRK